MTPFPPAGLISAPSYPAGRTAGQVTERVRIQPRREVVDSAPGRTASCGPAQSGGRPGDTGLIGDGAEH